MLYTKIQWRTANREQPQIIFSEFDSFGWENRRIEYRADGTIAWVSEHMRVGKNILLSEANFANAYEGMPYEGTPNAEATFCFITGDEFEAEWSKIVKSDGE